MEHTRFPALQAQTILINDLLSELKRDPYWNDILRGLTIPLITKDNCTNLVRILSLLVTEGFAKVNEPNMVGLTRVPNLDNKLGGFDVDLLYQDPDGSLIGIEIKSYFRDPTRAMVQKWETDIFERWTSRGFKVSLKMIGFTKREYEVFHTTEPVLWKILIRLTDLIRSFGIPKVDNFNWSTVNHLSVDELAQNLAPHLKTEFKEVPVKDITNSDEYLGVPDTVGLFEEFLNEQVLPTQELLGGLANFPGNITNGNPWNRDQQRLLNEEWGRSATHIMDVPQDHGVKLEKYDNELVTALLSELGLGKFGPVICGCNNAAEIQKEARAVLSEIAYLKSEYKGETTVKDQLLNVETTKLKALTKSVEDLGLSFSKHGGLVINDDHPLLCIGGKKGVYNKPEIFAKPKDLKKTVVATKDWLQSVDIFEGYIKEDFKTNFPDEVYSNVQPYKYTNVLCKGLINASKSAVDAIYSTVAGTTFRRQIKFYNALIMACSRNSFKGGNLNNIVVITVPNENWVVLASPPPNDSMSGALVVVYKGELPLCNKMSDSIRGCSKDGNLISVSKPFRLNWDVISKPQLLISHFLGSHLYFKSLGIDLKDNDLFNSLFLRFCQPMTKIFDTIYLLYKSFYVGFSYGKRLMRQKIEVMPHADIRVATILSRLNTNFPTLISTYAANNKFDGLTDPIFGFKHRSIDSILAIGYLKHIGFKHGGIDEKVRMKKFFEGELKFESDWFSSIFGNNERKGLHPAVNAPILEWSKYVLSERPLSWSALAYNTNWIYTYAKDLIRNPDKLEYTFQPYKFANKNVINTSTNSKINTLPFIRLGAKEDNVEDYGYKGLVSEIQDESVLALSLNTKRLANTKGTPVQQCINPNNEHWPEHEPVSVFEEICSDVITFKGKLAVTMVMKEQLGYDKRVFFVTNSWAITGFRWIESLCSEILKSSSSDLIHVPGDMKYVKITKFAKMFALGSMVETKDQTKFGDTYPLEAFMAVLQAMRDSGYINPHLFEVAKYILASLYGRGLLAPSTLSDLLEKAQNHINAGKKLEKKDQKVYDDAQKYSNFNDSVYKSYFDDELGVVGLNPGTLRHNGFILGVLNMFGSLLAAVGVRIKTALWNFIFKGVNRTPVDLRHSDDGFGFTSCPAPTAEDFNYPNDHSASEFVRIYLGDRPFVEKYWHSNKTIRLEFSEDEIVVFPETVVGKVSSILSILTSRLVGTQPSLAKEMIGEKGEMLQAIITPTEGVKVPVFRYSVAWGSELEGLSYNRDLTGACSRIYDSSTHGAFDTLVSHLLVAANITIADKFGYTTYLPDVNQRPVTMGGVFYIFPPLLKLYGFQAQDLRLMSFRTSVNKESWETRTTFSIVGPHWKSFKNESTAVSIIESDDFESTMSTSFKDFLIRYNRKQKTVFTHTRVKAVVSEMVEPALKQFGAKLSYDDLSTALKPYLILARNPVLKMIALEQKYLSTSFIAKNFKVSSDVYILADKGYLSRKFPNPFSRQFITDNKLVLPDVITIQDIWNLWSVSDTLVYQPESITLCRLYRTIFVNSRQTIESLLPRSELKIVNKTCDMRFTEFAELKVDDTMISGFKDAESILYAFYQEERLNTSGGPDFYKFFVGLPSPTSYLVSQAANFRKMLTDMGITFNIFKNILPFCIKLYRPLVKHLVAIVPIGSFTILDHLKYFYSSDKSIVIGNSELNTVLFKTALPIGYSDRTRLLLLPRILLQTNIVIESINDHEISMALEETRLTSYEKNVGLFNYMLALSLNENRSLFCVQPYWVRTKIDTIQVIMSWYSLPIASEDVPGGDLQLIARKLHLTKSGYVVYTNTRNENIIVMLCRMISYFFGTKESRFKDLNDLAQSSDSRVAIFESSKIMDNLNSVSGNRVAIFPLNWFNSPNWEFGSNVKQLYYQFPLPGMKRDYCIAPWSFTDQPLNNLIKYNQGKLTINDVWEPLPGLEDDYKLLQSKFIISTDGINILLSLVRFMGIQVPLECNTSWTSFIYVYLLEELLHLNVIVIYHTLVCNLLETAMNMCCMYANDFLMDDMSIERATGIILRTPDYFGLFKTYLGSTPNISSVISKLKKDAIEMINFVCCDCNLDESEPTIEDFNTYYDPRFEKSNSVTVVTKKKNSSTVTSHNLKDVLNNSVYNLIAYHESWKEAIILSLFGRTLKFHKTIKIPSVYFWTKLIHDDYSRSLHLVLHDIKSMTIANPLWDKIYINHRFLSALSRLFPSLKINVDLYSCKESSFYHK